MNTPPGGSEGAGMPPGPSLEGVTPWFSSSQLFSDLNRRLRADRARGGSLNVTRVEGQVGLSGAEEYRAMLEQWPAVGNNETQWKWGLSAAEFQRADTAVRYRGMALRMRQSFIAHDGLERIQAVWTYPDE